MAKSLQQLTKNAAKQSLLFLQNTLLKIKNILCLRAYYYFMLRIFHFLQKLLTKLKF